MCRFGPNLGKVLARRARRFRRQTGLSPTIAPASASGGCRVSMAWNPTLRTLWRCATYQPRALRGQVAQGVFQKRSLWHRHKPCACVFSDELDTTKKG
jgi:hypothetical protein